MASEAYHTYQVNITFVIVAGETRDIIFTRLASLRRQLGVE